MISIAPATGANNTAQFTKISVSAGSAALKAAAAAAALANITLQITDITTRLLLANRGTGIGVKSATAGSNVAVNKAVLARRNTLASEFDQFPIPPSPPGL